MRAGAAVALAAREERGLMLRLWDVVTGFSLLCVVLCDLITVCSFV